MQGDSAHRAARRDTDYGDRLSITVKQQGNVGLPFLVHLRGLALRIPRRSLALNARIVMWGYACYMSLGSMVGVRPVPMAHFSDSPRPHADVF